MASKNKDKPTPIDTLGTRQQQKERRRKLEAERQAANAERRRLGQPTPWEEKRAARAKERLAKQLAYKEAQDRKHEANRARDEREQRQRDANAKELLREATKNARKRVARAGK